MAVHIARFIMGRLLPKGMILPVLRGPLKGARFILGAGAGEGGGARVYFGMVEPQQTKLFLNRLKPGDTVFDVGANVGYYTLLASRSVGQGGTVYSFEPVPRNIVYLWRHIQLNHLENVKIIPAACAQSTSVTLFSLGDNCALGHLLSKHGMQKDLNDQSTIVPAVALDDIVPHIRKAPDVIKIDVEGAELEVLRGAQQLLTTRKPALFLSVHSCELRRNCLGFLQGMGYMIQPVDGAREDDSTEFVAW